MHIPSSRFEKYIFPIARNERLKFYYFAALIFLISIGNQTLSGLRDTLVITAPNSDATIIVYLRCFGTLPLGILFIMLFTWLIDRYSREVIFNSIFLGMSFFLIVFSYQIYPIESLIQPDPRSISELINSYPHFKWFFVIFGIWPRCTYYLLNDLWLTASLTILFWQLANQAVTTQEAKRFYPLFISVGGLAAILSGFGVVEIAEYVISQTAPQRTWMLTFQLANVLSVICYLMACLIHKSMWKHPFMEDAKFKPIENPKTNLLKGFQYLWKSPYLRAIFFILLTNEMIFQFNSVLWKDLLKSYLATPDDLNDFLSKIRIINGIGTMILAYATNFLIYHFGWRKIAFLAPIISLVTVSLFIGGSYLSTTYSGAYDFTQILIYAGSINIIILTWVSLAFLYTTKEMAYIPLSNEMKSKGKTAVDVLGYDLGEGGAAGTDAILTSYFAAGLLVTIPYVSVLLILLFALWFFSVHKLAGLYEILTKENKN